MLIEVGQKYINAVGNIVEIVKEESEICTFFDENNERYTISGNFNLRTYINHPFDLICLVDDNLLKQYEANEITQKEFIAKHIELYTGEKYDTNL